MGIKGLTDTVQPALPRIGKLRKGGEAPRNTAGQVVKMGADLDHFRFSSERPEVVAAFEDAYGQAPALVRIYLPYADVERTFQCWKEKWSAGGLVHRCDGETMQVWLGTDGQYHRTPKPCDGGCDEVGRLSVIIPELVQVGYVGYVTLETHSLNDLLSIQGSLLAAAEARAGNDLGLRGIQWNLRRVKEKVSTPLGNGKRARRDKWLVKLEPAADWVQLQLQAAHNATMMLPSGRPIQMQGDDVVPVDPQTGEIIEGTATVVTETTGASVQQATVGETRTTHPEQRSNTVETVSAQGEEGRTDGSAKTSTATPKRKISRSEVFARWQTLRNRAEELGIEGVAPLANDADSATIIERGKALKALIDRTIDEQDQVLADQAAAAGEAEAAEAAEAAF